jgi:hypothetical protein
MLDSGVPTVGCANDWCRECPYESGGATPFRLGIWWWNGCCSAGGMCAGFSMPVTLIVFCGRGCCTGMPTGQFSRYGARGPLGTMVGNTGVPVNEGPVGGIMPGDGPGGSLTTGLLPIRDPTGEAMLSLASDERRLMAMEGE